MKLRTLSKAPPADPSPAKGSIPRRGCTVAPLSFAQQRLWFLEQLDPGSPRFSILTAVRLRGSLSVDLVRRSLNEIVRRHEVLRTVFREQDGVPSQIILTGLDVEVPLVDLTALSGEREALTRALAGEEALRPFDLAQGPLIRILLIRSAPKDHVLILGLHQIVVDRWSRGLFVQEIGVLYDGFRRGTRPQLPELSIQYSDFTLWQHEQLREDALAGSLSYWRQQLQPPLPNLELPTDRVPPPLQSWKGAMEYSVIPQETLERLKRVGLKEGASLFVLLLAAWNALLHRYSGQRDIIVGSPVANRLHKDVEKLMGFFVNMLAIRLSLAGNPSLRELVARAREVALAALEHQAVPFERLVDELQIERELSRHPLFQVALTLQSSAMPPLQLPDLAVSLMEVDWGTTAYDLGIFFWETELWENLEPGLSITLVYSRELFDRTTMVRLIQHFEQITAQLAADPGTPISALALLSGPEQHQVLIEWNDSAADLFQNGSISRRFELQTRRTPAAPAVSFDGRSLTYEQLNRRANQLARRLRAMGVGPEDLVALSMERSIERVVAALAILKAGGAYMPLDPNHPPDRLAALLGDARPRLVLDASGLPGLLTSASAESEEDSNVSLDGESLACVIYTSGSTGTPKGVGIAHRAVIRLALANLGQLGAASRVAHATNVGFDAATFEIWGTLLLGAEIVILSHGEILDLPSRPDLLTEARIDALFLPTAYFHRIAAEAPGSFRSLTALLVGGEALGVGPAREILRQARPRSFFQMYGPTESTTFATSFHIGEVPDGATTLPIGRPIPGTGLYVLDADLQPLPMGVTGAIYLGGDGLARGYLRDPSLTAQKFLPSPFPRARGERLYRTGDLGAYEPDGSISFKGRDDGQIKIRGFRVELEEVETVLRMHPAVREAVVTTHRDGRGELQMVAHVVCSGEAASRKALSGFARTKLPGYMVPADFHVHDALPRTPHGKIDRRAVAQLRPFEAGESESRDQPRNAMEHVLAGVWREVLQKDVGVHDDFFEIGGHSLHATQISARLRRQLGTDLSVRSLFELRTIARLAETLPAA
jgi:amino acid adenylation domain-containing protein